MITRHTPSAGGGTSGRVKRLHRGAIARFRSATPALLDIGLINNMGDAALGATERQFRALLGAAGDEVTVRLTFYTLPEVPRSELGRELVSRYSTLDELWTRHHDGLIVTGAEPRAAELRDEPYWSSLTRVLDWAERNTYSTILSCLAAHAGILHLDGIVRQRLGDKRFGVYECARVTEHPLTAEGPSSLPMPHSRLNDIPEEALLACGYRVLTRSDAGVDAFVKQRRSLFVFFQGHPEYDGVTLMLEYRRDIGRFLRKERDTYPPMPHGYFDDTTVQTLATLQARAQADRREELLAEFPLEKAAGTLTNTWRPAAESIYRNWLLYICGQKERAATHRAIAADRG